MMKVGVTGGIGSGKSVVCRLLAEAGRHIISADLLARELTDTLPEINSAIRSRFGAHVFLPDGTLDRKALSAIVFHNPTERIALDQIIHPHVFSSLESKLKNLSDHQSKPYVVIEAALIYETGMDEWLDYVIVVHADDEERIRRVMCRDAVSREDVEARIRSQMPQAEKMELADFAIENNGTLEELGQRVLFVDRLLSTMRPAGK